MHAHRCPVAQLRAASQQQQSEAAALSLVSKQRNAPTTSNLLPSMINTVKEAKTKPVKTQRSSQTKTSKSQENLSFFQQLHGDAAPVLPPRPQMYSDDTWKPNLLSKLSERVHYNQATNNLFLKEADQPLVHTEAHQNPIKRPEDDLPTRRQTNQKLLMKNSEKQSTIRREAEHKLLTKRPTDPSLIHNEPTQKILIKKFGEQPLIYNENCAIHGHNKTRPLALPKSASIPPPTHQVTRVSGERLKNWRRNSLAFAANALRRAEDHTPSPRRDEDKVIRRQTRDITQQRSLSSGKEFQPHSSRPERTARPSQPQQQQQQRQSSSVSSNLSSATLSSNSLAKGRVSFADLHGRRSQFRRAWSLFSLGHNQVKKETPTPQRILRQPTRHVYRRGISGLPIECTNRHLLGVTC